MELDEMIAVLQAAKEGKKLELRSRKIDTDWSDCTDSIWNFAGFDYRIKPEPEPTREEITQNWVKDNNIKVGSKVKIIRPSERVYVWDNEKNQTIGQVCAVKKIENDAISLIVGEINGWSYDVESLEPYKEEYIPFTFEDREMFRDKWIRNKMGKNENKINFIAANNSVSCAGWTELESLSSLFKTHEFVDGTPFGKLKE
jgi:hypothetical protein